MTFKGQERELQTLPCFLGVPCGDADSTFGMLQRTVFTLYFAHVLLAHC